MYGWVSDGTDSGDGYYPLPVSGGGTDDYGFSALPGGSGYSNSGYNYYNDIGFYGFLWTSSENSVNMYNADVRYFNNNSDQIFGSITGFKTNWTSIRCVKD